MVVKVKKLLLFIFAVSAFFYLVEGVHAPNTPLYILSSLDVNTGNTWGSGTIICKAVDLQAGGVCSTLAKNTQYLINVTLDNLGIGSAKPSDFDFYGVVGSNLAMGDISSCAAYCKNDADTSAKIGSCAINGGDVNASYTGGNICTIASGGGRGFLYYVITTGSDGGDNAGTFFASEDDTAIGEWDWSEPVIFTYPAPPTYLLTYLDVNLGGTWGGSGGDSPVLCSRVDLTAADQRCSGTFQPGTQYLISAELASLGITDAQPTDFDINGIIGAGRALGSISSCAAYCKDNAGAAPVSGTCAINGNDMNANFGTPCTIGIAASGFLYFVVTTDPSDAADGDDYAILASESGASDWSTTVDFNVNDAPTITVVLPNGGEEVKDVYTTRVNITDPDCLVQADCPDMNVSMWYSTSQYGREFDLNTVGGHNVPVANMACSDYDFVAGSTCDYDWDTRATPGDYPDNFNVYLDVNVFDGNIHATDTSNFDWNLDNVPDINNITNNATQRWDNNIAFVGNCTNDGDTFKMIVCKEGVPCDNTTPYSDMYCQTDYNSAMVKVCSTGPNCALAGAGVTAYGAICIDVNTNYDLSPEPDTFDVNNTFSFTDLQPPDNDSNKNCVLDSFSVSGVAGCDGVPYGLATVKAMSSDGNVWCQAAGQAPGDYADCTAQPPLGTNTWIMEISDTLNLFDTNITTRTYNINNDTFSVTNWFPIDNYSADGGTGEAIDFNTGGTAVTDSCGNQVSDANVTFRDVTEDLNICWDDANVGKFSCFWDAGVAPLDGSTETWDMRIFKEGWDVYDSADRTLNITGLEDLTFSLSYPASGCSDTNGCDGACGGGSCEYCNFGNAGILDQNQVACSGQTPLVPFYSYDNQSSSTLQDWTMDLNYNLDTSKFRHKVSNDANGYEGVCTDLQPPASGHCLNVDTNAAKLIGDEIGWADPTADINAWAWADFINVTPSDSNTGLIANTSSAD